MAEKSNRARVFDFLNDRKDREIDNQEIYDEFPLISHALLRNYKKQWLKESLDKLLREDKVKNFVAKDLKISKKDIDRTWKESPHLDPDLKIEAEDLYMRAVNNEIPTFENDEDLSEIEVQDEELNRKLMEGYEKQNIYICKLKAQIENMKEQFEEYREKLRTATEGPISITLDFVEKSVLLGLQKNPSDPRLIELALKVMDRKAAKGDSELMLEDEQLQAILANSSELVEVK